MGAGMAILADGWPYSSLPVTLVLCSGGLVNILYAFGLGYGLSMMANAALCMQIDNPVLFSASGSPTPALCGMVLYFSYGARLATFLWRRQASASYSSKFKQVADKSQKMPLVAKCGITFFVALSQALYVLPLHFAATSPEVELSSLTLGCVVLASGGLLLETIADEQKLSDKSTNPSAPVMTGLYKRCRHPNYLGEIAFHAGVCGLCSTASWTTSLIGATSPLFMIWVMCGAAKRLDADQATRNAGNEKYQSWVKSTYSLLPKLG
jgi:steroid 5-alpha reductase family enzyme